MKVSGAVVIVTGRADLLGDTSSRMLRSAGAQVLSIGPSDYDLRRPREVRDMLRSIRPEAVIHVAEQVPLGARPDTPRAFYEAAIVGVELIEACRVFGVQRLLLSETRWALPRIAAAPAPRDAAGSLESPAVEALDTPVHRMLDAQVALYRQQTSLDVSLLSLWNLYAPDADYSGQLGAVVADLSATLGDAVARGLDEVHLWSDASPATRLQHVESAARLMCDALATDGVNTPAAAGETTLAELTSAVADHVGFRGRVVWSAGPQAGQPLPLAPAGAPLREFVAWWASRVLALPNLGASAVA